MSAGAPPGAPAPAAPEPGGAAGAVAVGAVLAGRYRILRKLGEGAMGAVYLGEHLRIGRRDAIKVLRPALAADAEALARFGRGARNVSLIQHPNVCTVYDFGDLDDGARFLAMEYVPGETLHDLLEREGRLPPARAVAIAAQVAAALQAAHDAGIVHRDLKPGNVMVSPGRGGADAVKVVDFDIAKGSREGEAADVTRLGFVIGTPEYMSPEQLLGMALDGRSDVYSLALVLFRMLAGALPFRAHDTQELMVQRLTGAPLRLDEVLPALGALPALQAALDRGLQRRAEDRFESAAAFSAAIARALDELPRPAALSASASGVVPAAVPDPGLPARDGVAPTVLEPGRAQAPPEGTSPPARPRRTPALVAGGVLAIALAAAGAWGLTRAMGPPASAEPAPPTAFVPAAPDVRAGVDVPPTPRPESVAPPVDSAAAPTASPRETRDRSADPVAIVDREEERGEETRKEPARAVPDPPPTDRRDAAPRVDPPPPPPPPPAERGGAAEAEATLARLQDRVGPPYPAAAELRRIRDQAREVWELGGAISTRERASAAFILAHAELGLDNVDGCVRWAEAAVRLRPGGARQLLLDECRRVRG